jgi:hypothetical protein
MKRAVLFAILAIAISSPAYAILRPRFPAKTRAPFYGDFIIIGDDAAKIPGSAIRKPK